MSPTTARTRVIREERAEGDEGREICRRVLLVRGTEPMVLAGRAILSTDCPTPPSQLYPPYQPYPPHLPQCHQSNLTPKRASRGGTIVVGSWNVAPEFQLMFWAGLTLVRLYPSMNPEMARFPMGIFFSTRTSKR
jgi:hypothetical protein